MSATGPVSHLESLKTVIWRSYLVENKTLEELVAELRENHGFHLTYFPLLQLYRTAFY